jgi:hypothetical protein
MQRLAWALFPDIPTLAIRTADPDSRQSILSFYNAWHAQWYACQAILSLKIFGILDFLKDSTF